MAISSCLRSRIGTFVAAALILSSASAFGQQAPAPLPIKNVPNLHRPDGLAGSAFDMLWNHCARCHQAGLTQVVNGPQGGISNILFLDEIAAARYLIQPGNALNSKLYQKVIKGQMPADIADNTYSGPTVSQDEMNALRDWINSLSPSQDTAKCEARKFVTNDAMVSEIQSDLLSQAPNRIVGRRYITLVNLYNACVSDELMDAYRKATIKLLNSLSGSPAIVALDDHAIIGAEKAIIGFNIEDLQWSEADWNTLLSVYPYPTKPNNSAQFTAIADATKTVLPYVRGDWFANNASHAPLYTFFLRLDDSFDKEIAKLAQPVADDINAGSPRAMRAGQAHSGVSLNNRFLERHQRASGYFWTTYDFNSSSDVGTNLHDVFQHPFGPAGVAAIKIPTGASPFTQNGGETIFTLPNGFQGYFVSAQDGGRLDKAATNIVLDHTRRDQAVTNGISCMGCHSEGIKSVTDEVRKFVEQRTSPDAETRAFLVALFPEQNTLDKAITADQTSFSNALKNAEVATPLTISDGALGGSNEIINSLSLRQDLNLTLIEAAAELGLTPDQLDEESRNVGGLTAQLYTSLKGSNIVPRDKFEAQYLRLVAQLNNDTVVSVAGLPGAVVLPPPRIPPVNAFVSSTQEASKDVEISLALDRKEYKEGDIAQVYVNVNRSCYATLVGIDDNGTASLLTDSHVDNFVHGGNSSFGANGVFNVTIRSKNLVQLVGFCDVSAHDPLSLMGVTATESTLSGFKIDHLAQVGRGSADNQLGLASIPIEVK